MSSFGLFRVRVIITMAFLAHILGCIQYGGTRNVVVTVFKHLKCLELKQPSCTGSVWWLFLFTSWVVVWGKVLKVIFKHLRWLGSILHTFWNEVTIKHMKCLMVVLACRLTYIWGRSNRSVFKEWYPSTWSGFVIFSTHLGVRLTIKHLKCLMAILAHSLGYIRGSGNENVFGEWASSTWSS